MKKIASTLVACLLAFGVAAPAFADLGLSLPGGSKGGGGGDIDGQVKAFTEKSAAINNLVYVSLKAINAAYASDEDAKKLAEETKAFNAITDPKEKQAKVAEALKTESAKLEELSKSKDAQEKTKALDKDKQKQVANGVGNFLIAALRATELANDGKSLVQSVATNPTIIGKVLPVKNSLPILLDAAKTATKVIPGFINVLKGADIQVSKVTAESKVEDDPFGK
jgi:hypothetical protein